MCRRKLYKYILRQLKGVKEYKNIVKFLMTDLKLDKIKNFELTWDVFYINLLEPTGYVMHHQFNTQQLYVLPTLYLCVFYLSENKQLLVPLIA